MSAEISKPATERYATGYKAAATVCALARAVLFTGGNPYRGGFYDNIGFFGATLQRDEVTLPKLLKEGGYEIAFFGKWHQSRLDSELSVNKVGFGYSLATKVDAFGTEPRKPEKFIRNDQPTVALEGWNIDVIYGWIFERRVLVGVDCRIYRLI
ncbi:sulfatase-like hydrolase/transferase [Lunatimonas salinarum]|uniref:sulfatase-like hydrolase/transferase n=1 Tax=Lunatimonas salinarum TaxID=1774590 RepID=UPI0031587857